MNKGGRASRADADLPLPNGYIPPEPLPAICVVSGTAVQSFQSGAGDVHYDAFTSVVEGMLREFFKEIGTETHSFIIPFTHPLCIFITI